MGLTDGAEEAFDFSSYLADPANQVTLSNEKDEIGSGEADEAVAASLAQARDPETGRFVKSVEETEDEESEEVEESEDEESEEVEEDEETEDEEPEEEDEETEDEEPEEEDEETDENGELILGKFKSAEDLAKSYMHAESQLGKLRNELSEMKKVVEQLADSKDEPEEDAVVVTPALRQQVLEAAEDDPHHAVGWVLQNVGYDDPLFDEVMVEFYRQDPGEARRIERSIERAIRDAEAEVERSAREQEAQAVRSQTLFAEATTVFAERHKDLVPFAAFLDEAAEANPMLAKQLAEAKTVEEAVEWTRALALAAKGMKADTLTREVAKVATERTAKAAAKKVKATVASSGATVNHEVSKKKATEDYVNNVLGAPVPGSIAAGLTRGGE